MKELLELRDLCRPRALWFSVEYVEAEDTWYGCVNSSAPVEVREFKRYPLDELFAAMKAHVASV